MKQHNCYSHSNYDTKLFVFSNQYLLILISSLVMIIALVKELVSKHFFHMLVTRTTSKKIETEMDFDQSFAVF